MTVLVMDVLAHISQFCQLRDRYRWSVSHRRFQITGEEWTRYARGYALTSIVNLRRVILRQYGGSLIISQRPGCVWSEHLNEPLTVWSPWTLPKLCTLAPPKAYFRFRECRFVQFVQNIVHTLGLKSSVVRRLNHVECVYATVWSINTAKIPIRIWSDSKWRNRRCLASTLGSLRWKRLRCLLEFRVMSQQLRLRVKGLEFSIL